MRMTEEGLALIRRFEGLRHEAYRDAVGVWTIGYGHTSEQVAKVRVDGSAILVEYVRAVTARTHEYLATVDRLLARLEPARLDAAVEIAELPDRVRGFGPIKLENARTMRVRQAALLADYESSALTLPSAPRQTLAA